MKSPAGNRRQLISSPKCSQRRLCVSLATQTAVQSSSSLSTAETRQRIIKTEECNNMQCWQCQCTSQIYTINQINQSIKNLSEQMQKHCSHCISVWEQWGDITCCEMTVKKVSFKFLFKCRQCHWRRHFWPKTVPCKCTLYMFHIQCWITKRVYFQIISQFPNVFISFICICITIGNNIK